MSGRGAGHLEVDSGGVVFAGVEFGLVMPGPARYGGAVDDQPGARLEVVCGGGVLGRGSGDRGRLGGQDSGDGGLGDCERFGEGLLSEVVAQAGQNESDAPVGAEPA